MGGRLHFEVFVRKNARANWALEMATENRQIAVDTARELVEQHRVAAARVNKETFSEDTGEFQSVTILNLGLTEAPKKAAAPEEDLQPLCITPQDLYTLHARSRIGRLLDTWLAHQKATPFELLHQPRLIERLETSGVELLHAIQKLSVPEAQARGKSVHELIRAFQRLTDQAIERVLRDGRRGILPDLKNESFAALVERLSGNPDRAYLLGAAIASAMAEAPGWAEKVSRLVDLAEAAPAQGPGRKLALETLAQPLAEILGTKPGLETMLGGRLEMGAHLAALSRLAASEVIEPLIVAYPAVAKNMPDLPPEAVRVARWISTEEFAGVRAALGQRILLELKGPRRLHPEDTSAEIERLRSLGLVLSAAAGKLLPLEDVQAAFAARSRMLVTSAFVEAYLADAESSIAEAELLVRLTENIIGAANKREAGRWLRGLTAAHRFETGLRENSQTPSVRLALLAKLSRQIGACGLVIEDYAPIQAKLGEIGGMIEADAKLTRQLGRANVSASRRFVALMKMASGEDAPMGPAADRARAEAMRLARDPETRAEIAAMTQAGAQSAAA